MADQSLAETSPVTASRIARDERVRGIEKHTGLSRFLKSILEGEITAFVLDCGAVLSHRFNGRSVPTIAELCRIYSSGLTRRDGLLRVRGMVIHFLNFPSFLYAYREIFVRSIYRFKSVRTAPRILDCGANIGLATLFFKLQWPESTVSCFEPDPQTFALLCRNMAENGLAGVQTFNVAVWDSEGEIEFYTEREIPGSLRMSAVPGWAGSVTTHVRAIQLSSFIGEEQVDLLKLDVEGAEQMVIEDLAASGKLRLVNAIIAEYHHRMGGRSSRLSEFLGVLERSGFDYQIHAAWRPVHDARPAQDILIYAQRVELEG